MHTGCVKDEPERTVSDDETVSVVTTGHEVSRGQIASAGRRGKYGRVRRLDVGLTVAEREKASIHPGGRLARAKGS